MSKMNEWGLIPKTSIPGKRHSDRRTTETPISERKNEGINVRLQIEITDRMNRLMSASDFLREECVNDVEYLCDARNKVTESQRRRVDDLLTTLGVTKLFLEIWKKYFEMDFLKKENSLMKNLMNGILWALCNSMARSTALCVQVFESDLYKVVLNYLKTDYLKPSKTVDPNCEDVVDGLNYLLYNMLQKVPESIQSLREQEAFYVFQRFRRGPSYKIACLALILQGYIITEEENELVNSDDSNLISLKVVLERALMPNNYRRRADVFSPIVVTSTLNRLAVIDNNKPRIVKVGLLPFYVELLQPRCSEDEQEAAAEGLWTLAFKCAQGIEKEPGCVAALKKLAEGNSERLKRLAEGVLWTLKESKRMRISCGQISRSGQEGQRHVFISYQLDSQPVIKQLVSALKMEGFRVWVDFDNMSGSILEAMAKAVEEAAVVVVCLSQKYKESPNCRTEAEYTFRLRKEILPLRLQSHYWPDGWLGAMIGNRRMHDFTSDGKYSESIKNVIRELGERGKTTEYEEVIRVEYMPEKLPREELTRAARPLSNSPLEEPDSEDDLALQPSVPTAGSSRGRISKVIRVKVNREKLPRRAKMAARPLSNSPLEEPDSEDDIALQPSVPTSGSSRGGISNEPDSEVDIVTQIFVPTAGSSEGRISTRVTWNTDGSRTMYEETVRERFSPEPLGACLPLNTPPLEEPGSEVAIIPQTSVPTTGSSRGRISTCSTWTFVEVMQWLQENNLEKFQYWLRAFDGTLLIRYKTMLESAPETFYSMLRDRFALKDMLKLSEALMQL